MGKIDSYMNLSLYLNFDSIQDRYPKKIESQLESFDSFKTFEEEKILEI